MRKEYNFKSINLVKLNDYISGCIIHDEERRSVIVSTIDGSVHVWNSQLDSLKCCNNIRAIVKSKSEILFGGDNGILYFYNERDQIYKVK